MLFRSYKKNYDQIPKQGKYGRVNYIDVCRAHLDAFVETKSTVNKAEIEAAVVRNAKKYGVKLNKP